MNTLAAHAAIQAQEVLRIRVVDAVSSPILNVEVSVLTGLRDVLASGVTNASGQATLAVPSGTRDIQIVARHIGFQRTERFLSLAQGERLTVDIHMDPIPHSLAPVKVTAQEDLKRRSYFVDADDIASSNRLILNGMDVLTKMRPDIITGRAPNCGVHDIYVNGTRIVNAPRNEMAIAHMPKILPRRVLAPNGVRVDGRSTAIGGPDLGESPSPLASIWSIMWTIKPEHIEQMEYKDCFDTSMPGTHGSSALYVVLKPGVAYDPGVGSYVIDSSATPLRRVSALRRLLGAYDQASGAPVSGAIVVDSATGDFVRTSDTGTANLAFLPGGLRTVIVRKRGYDDQRLAVVMSPSDTTPITLVLTRRP